MATPTPRPTLARINPWDLKRLFNEGRFISRLRAGKLTAASVWISDVKPDNPRIGKTIPLGSISQRLELYDSNNSMVAEYQRFIKPDGKIGGSGRNDPKLIVLNNVEYHQPRQNAVLPRLKNKEINRILNKRGFRACETYVFYSILTVKKWWHVDIRPRIEKAGLLAPKPK